MSASGSPKCHQKPVPSKLSCEYALTIWPPTNINANALYIHSTCTSMLSILHYSCITLEMLIQLYFQEFLFGHRLRGCTLLTVVAFTQLLSNGNNSNHVMPKISQIHGKIKSMAKPYPWQSHIRDKVKSMTTSNLWQSHIHDKVKSMAKPYPWQSQIYGKVISMTKSNPWQNQIHGSKLDAVHCSST